jgi:hypothetical protein
VLRASRAKKAFLVLAVLLRIIAFFIGFGVISRVARS